MNKRLVAVVFSLGMFLAGGSVWALSSNNTRPEKLGMSTTMIETLSPTLVLTPTTEVAPNTDNKNCTQTATDTKQTYDQRTEELERENTRLREEIKKTDTEMAGICSNSDRDSQLTCEVKKIKKATAEKVVEANTGEIGGINKEKDSITSHCQ